jgi:hypothetical protein
LNPVGCIPKTPMTRFVSVSTRLQTPTPEAKCSDQNSHTLECESRTST